MGVVVESLTRWGTLFQVYMGAFEKREVVGCLSFNAIQLLNREGYNYHDVLHLVYARSCLKKTVAGRGGGSCMN